MNLLGNLVNLRAIEKKDALFLLELVNSPEMEYWVVGSSVPTSSIQQEKWMENIANSHTDIRLVVENKEGTVVGFANLVQIDPINRTAVHGVKFAKEFRGCGYAKDTVMAIMRYAFDTLNLNRLESTILEYNDSSIGLYTKACGWSIEGVKKSAVYKNGKYNNLVMIGITKDDFKQFSL
ncbi:GNAT family N-acetyltransferase [Pseudoalteromonas lipolytica]|jgi:RimJ/RimL family protein N-acetyltransferase|uniref:GNAT family N-acetyltransferase n=1 Tax=Pseudoalteromonas lipolytica TaxID=570156 RepID=UPI000826E957|nr:GNAT family protein [Pseudoalteromonas lipolytica]